MSPIIQEHLLAKDISCQELLDACWRLRIARDEGLSSIVETVLACKHYETFVALMHREEHMQGGCGKRRCPISVLLRVLACVYHVRVRFRYTSRPIRITKTTELLKSTRPPSTTACRMQGPQRRHALHQCGCITRVHRVGQVSNTASNRCEPNLSRVELCRVGKTAIQHVPSTGDFSLFFLRRLN